MRETPLLLSLRSRCLWLRAWLRASAAAGGSLPSAPPAPLGLQALPTLPAKAGASVPSPVEGARPRGAPVPQGSAWLCRYPPEMEVPQPGGMGTGAAQAPPGLVWLPGRGRGKE